MPGEDFRRPALSVSGDVLCQRGRYRRNLLQDEVVPRALLIVLRDCSGGQARAARGQSQQDGEENQARSHRRRCTGSFVQCLGRDERFCTHDALASMSENLPPGRFFGTSVSRWRAGPFQLSESVYEAHTVLRPHAHARAYLTLVLNGGHREKAGSDERDCTPATVVFHPAAERHANWFSPAGGRIFRLEIDDAWLNRLRESGASLDKPAESHRGPLSQIASQIFSEFRTRDSLSALMIEGLALEFATRTVRIGRSTVGISAPKWLRLV